MPLILLKQAEENNNNIFFIDSDEVLEKIPSSKNLTKIPAFYPKCYNFIKEYKEKFDAILVYSVLQYIFVETNIYEFLDTTLSLLKISGSC